MSLLERISPLLGQLRQASREDLKRDLQAGLTTAVMLVPQGMAYAMLAGLPPITGLYASVVPLALYALLGTSRQLAVGPVAMISMMVAASVGALAAAGTGEALGYAVLLAGMVGLIQLFMGVARLGFLVKLLSHPVVSGFTSGAALLIAGSQVSKVLGFPIPRGPLHETVGYALAHIGQTHLPTLVLALGGVGLLLALRRWSARIPGALVVVILGTALVWALGLDDRGVAIVGAVPAGMPALRLPPVDLHAVRLLLPSALAISLVGFMESIAVAKGFARRNGYELDTDKELLALGAANIGSALFQGFPVTGGFSRTAVNATAGATTNLAGLLTSGAVLATLLFLTPLFHFLPHAALAAIILTAVLGLVDVREVGHLWRTDRPDLGLLLLTFASTLLLGIEAGIGIGVAASALWFIARTANPHVAVLGRVRVDGIYRDVSRHPDAQTWPGLLLLRIDAPLYFANATSLKKTLARLEAEEEHPVRAVVLDMAAVGAMDSSAVSALEEVAFDLHDRGVKLYMAAVTGQVRDRLARGGLEASVGADRFVHRVEDAVRTFCAEGH